ncbi:MAG TPA: hypothetical protein VK171_01890 [Fimbriimonas sp.]|nr:hypothetical protein [Fimbriimonas sp.]
MAEAFPPDPEALFLRLCSLVSDDMLKVISKSDYGMDARKHLHALRKLTSNPSNFDSQGWDPHEVLSLFRWARYSDQHRKGGFDQFMMAKAFAASAVLSHEYSDHPDFSSNAVFPLLESCLMLGEDFCTLLLQSMTYAMVSLEPWDEDYLFAAFAMVAIFTLVPELGARVDFDELADWFVSAHVEIIAWHRIEQNSPKIFAQIGYLNSLYADWTKLLRIVVGATMPDSPLRLFHAEFEAIPGGLEALHMELSKSKPPTVISLLLDRFRKRR